MPIGFNADEIFQIAEQIERNGAKFYRKAATGNPVEGKFLEQLAKMEDGHLKIFQAMHKEVLGTETENAFDPDGEASLYLQAVAGGYVFDVKRDPSELLTGKESLKDILKTAIGLEKDSVVFYTGIKEMVGRKAGKDKIDHIISEELKHITYLSEELKKVS